MEVTMKYILLFLLLVMFSISGQGQDNGVKPDIKDIKTKMVLRANTRDKMTIVRDNFHRPQLQIRRKVIQSQQKKVMHQHMNHIQQQRIYRHRMLQLRKKRIEAARRRKLHGR